MPALRPSDTPVTTAGRRWLFGDCEFAEVSRQLLVAGRPVKLESKPLDVLQQLLEHPAQVLTKDELIGAAWSTATTDQSLATAISKLRKAFGGTRDAVILNVSGVGYRMAVPVTCKVETDTAPPGLHLQPGDPIPACEDWLAVEPLAAGTSPSVWLARHCRTHETHVFKFATDGIRLRALQREVALSRLFAQTLRDDARFVRILHWNFDEAPFFIESAFQGANLLEFSQTDAFRRMPVEGRVALAAEITGAVAEAHELGALHNDLKPGNILLLARHGSDPGSSVAPNGNGHSNEQSGTAGIANGAGSARPASGWQIKVADFGVASLHDPARLLDLQITQHGEFDAEPSSHETSGPIGTAMYRAPELLSPGAIPSMRGDVYALGVLLYQMVCGDFMEPPSPGWEARIADPLLREDIAAAANIDPQQRLASAADLTARLLALPARRLEREQSERGQALSLQAEQAMARARVRRPWIVLALVALVVGVCASLWFYRRAVEQRNAALAQSATLAAMNDFLTVDLLNQSNPLVGAAHAGATSQETLAEAIERALPQIDRRFAHDPAVAGQIHETLAAALDARTEYVQSDEQFGIAADRFRSAAGPLSPDAIRCELRRQNSQLRRQTAASVAQARAGFAQQQVLIAQLPHISAELQAWQAMVQTGVMVFSSHTPEQTVDVLAPAVRRAEETPGFNPVLLSALRLRFCGIYLKLNRGADAERLARELLASSTAAGGPESPATLQPRVYLEEALLLEGKYGELIAQINRDYPLLARVLGPEHQLALSALDVRAQAEGMVEDYPAAIRDSLAVHAAAAASPSAAFMAGDTLNLAAELQCRNGDYTAGMQTAQQLLHGSEGAAAQPYFLSTASLDVAECLLAQQENSATAAHTLSPNAASSSLADRKAIAHDLSAINLNAVAEYSGGADFAGRLRLAKARLALLQGQTDVARQDAAAAASTFEQPGADPYERRQFERVRSQLGGQKQ